LIDVNETFLRDERPKFAEDVSLFLLDDTGVVFSESAQEIYHLNTTATFIWCQIEEGLNRSEVARQLGQTFGISQKEAELHVQEAIAGWKKHGILAGSGSRDRIKTTATDPSAPVTALERIAVPPLQDRAPTRDYQVLGGFYRVQFANSDLESWVRPLLRHLERSAPEGSEPKRGTVSAEPNGFSIALEGIQLFRCAQVEEVGHLTDMAIFFDALRQNDTALSLHAGAVCQGDRALILPGSAGSGKTTLTAALVHEGLHYLSDDLVLLDIEKSAVRGVPFSLSVKESGVEVLSDRFPGLKDLPVHIRPDRKRVRYLPLDPAWQSSELDSPPRICWIVFPTYDPKGANDLISMSPSKALVELTRGCTMMRRVTRDEVRGLISLIEDAECFEIEVSSLNQAIDLLIALWHDRS
jgi:hypothetical protein